MTNRGVFVRELSVTEVRELYDIRAALFGLAGRLMAERATPAEVEALERMLVAMEQAAELRDFEAYYPLNLAFHGMIVDGSGNASLARQYRAFVKALNLFPRPQPRAGRRPRRLQPRASRDGGGHRRSRPDLGARDALAACRGGQGQAAGGRAGRGEGE